MLAKHKTFGKGNYQRKQPKTINKKVKVLEKKVNELKPDLKYFQTGIDKLKFAEYNSGSGDSAAVGISWNVMKQGSAQGQRVADKIRIEKIEISFEVVADKLISDVPYAIDCFLAKEQLTAPITQSDLLNIYQADDFSPANPGNGISTRSFYNMERKKAFYTRLAGMSGNAKSYQTATTGYIKNHRLVIKKPFTWQFNYNQNTGFPIDLVKNAFIVVWRAGGRTDSQFSNQTLVCQNFTIRYYYTDL